MENGSNRTTPDSKDVLDKPAGANGLIVVGIGASAGGVQALQKFFQNVPPNTNIAYVVILHLSPDYDSKLAEVLQSVTKLPVKQVRTKVKVEPDHVYVVPPNQHLTMLHGEVAVSPNLEIEDRRAPVDIFFRTLANVYGPRAVAVILSGTGANGSMGLKRVKELGGAAFVQNPREAEFNEMPRNAIATGIVDDVLPVTEIPGRIIAYKQHMGRTMIPGGPEEPLIDHPEALRDILTQLRIQTGHDFTNYKRPTLLRRIERRINVRGVPDLEAYAHLLRENKDEAGSLLKDLLISVTNFFRDKTAFEIIEKEVLPLILKNKRSGDQLRIWIVGCATGEEAYSLAMLCAEMTPEGIEMPKVQIFATDIDESAIAHARDGLYTINDAADLSAERLGRFFNKEGDMYRVRPEIRELILFANHNVLKDPPFSHIDLISSRNVLIYLNRTAQTRVMETFHFAMEPNGFLFLGTSETSDAAPDLYEPFNRDNHIYHKRRLSASRLYPVPEAVPHLRFEQRTKASGEGRMDKALLGDIHIRLLEHYAPPSLVIDENYDVVHVSERAGRYLQVGAGELSQNLLKLVRHDLRLELRSVLYQASQRNLPAQARGLKVTIERTTETINIHARPVMTATNPLKGLMLVLFEQVEEGTKPADVVVTTNEPIARQLEEELTRVKAQLRASNEQHDFHAEELKASNEELQAMNEELRSSAEELETSKEELQSINEELRTVNQELKIKVEETTLANNNLQNLIHSVDIGTIFLDRSLRLAFFTPRAGDLFNLIESDYGRPLSHITSRFDSDGLIADVGKVLSTLQPIERIVQTDHGRIYMMRVLPYRTGEDRVGGVVLTFIDLTSRKKIEEDLRASEERLRLLIEGAKDYAIFTFDLERRVNTWNTGAQAMMGYTESEIIGQPGDILFVPEDRAKDAPEYEMTKALREGVAENERWHLRKDGSRFYGSGTVRPLRDQRGQLIGLVKIMRDLTESKKAADSLRESEERFRAIVSQTTAGIYSTDLTGILALVNKKFCNLVGIPEERLLGKSAWDLIHPEDLESNKSLFASMTTDANAYNLEKRLLRKDGSVLWVSESVSAICDGRGFPQSAVAVVMDITERKNLEEQKDEFIGIASHELKTPVTSIKAYAEILQEKFARSEQADHVNLMQKLNNQIDRLADLVKDLLDTTRIAEGKLQLHLQPVDLNELITEQIEELQRIAPASSIVFEPSRIKTVDADRERIGQVLTNLIMNAIKYSPSGSKVVVTTEGNDRQVKVRVADQGVGIAEEFKEKVFDRFFRLNNRKSENLPGMGLGLYISAAIIQRHGGKISVDSEVGKGSVFWFTLPCG